MKRGRGRPRGRTDLRRGAKRFRRPIADVVRFVTGLAPYPSAAFAAAFDIADFVVIPSRSGPRFAVLKRMDAEGRESTLIGAAGRIVRSGIRPDDTRTFDETQWHHQSGAYLWGAIHGAATGNREGEDRNLNQLAKLDSEWPARWKRFVSAILTAPVRPDLQPGEATLLPRTSSALMRAIARHRGRDIERIFRASSNASAAAT